MYMVDGREKVINFSPLKSNLFSAHASFCYPDFIPVRALYTIHIYMINNNERKKIPFLYIVVIFVPSLVVVFFLHYKIKQVYYKSIKNSI